MSRRTRTLGRATKAIWGALLIALVIGSGQAAALVLTPAVGMLASIGVMTAGLAHAFGERRWQVILLIGAGTAIGLYVVFESTLRIMFPRGAFG